MRRSVSGASLISAAVLAGVLALCAIAASLSTNFDFRAFYCAGAAVRTHANPYRTEPLHTCEWRRTDARLAAFAREIVVPAPQPGYDLAAFALLSALPFSAAAKLWTAFLALCAVITVLAVQRFSREPLTLIALAFWLSLGITSISLGELVPVCALAVSLAALYAQRGNRLAAGICAAATLVEPHIGMPVVLAMLLWAPRARAALCASAALLAAVSLAVLGFAQNAEYVASVLPAHAASELASDAQLSAAVVAHWLGASDAAALRFGTLSYLTMTAIGAGISRLLARRYADGAFLAAVPAAFSVFGGVFIHVTEAALALPLVFLCLRYFTAPTYVRALGLAVLLLSVPWWSLATPMLLSPQTSFAMAGVVLTYTAWRLSGGNLGTALGCGTFGVLAAAGLVHWHALTSIASTSVNAPPQLFAAKYPEANWAWVNATYMSTGSPATWALRALTWGGLLCTGLTAVLAALTHSRARDRENAAVRRAGAA